MAAPAAAVEAGNILPVPIGLDLATASLIEPVAAVVRGLRPLGLQPADTVLVCGAGPMGLITLIVAKQRHGATGKVRLRFEPKVTRFSDLADDALSAHAYD